VLNHEEQWAGTLVRSAPKPGKGEEYVEEHLQKSKCGEMGQGVPQHRHAELWADSERVACLHWGGGVATGWLDVRNRDIGNAVLSLASFEHGVGSG
jgi:hypothetical protein